MYKIVALVGIIFFLGTVFCFSQTDEQITITTYYPSPYGVYRELVVDRDLTDNADTIMGFSVDIDESGTNTGTVTGLDVDVSGVASGTVYAATFQGGNVGIGIATPTSALDVNGTIDATSYSVGGTAGYNGDITVGDGAGGTCTITVTNGIITATTCP